MRASLRRGRRPPSDLKERLVRAGVSVASSRRGTLTIRAVAEKVRKTQQAVYLHYRGGLEDLKGAVAIQGFERLATALQDAAGESRAPKARLAAVTRAYIAFAVKRPGLYRLMLSGEFASACWPTVKDRRRETMDVIKGVVQEAQRAGLVRDGAVDHLAWILWALAHARATIIAGDEDKPLKPPAVQEWADRTVKTFLVGVGA